jgi:ComF family protein
MASAKPEATHTLIEQAKRAASATLGLLFPPRCVVCGRVGTLLCGESIAAFDRVPEPFCPVCGEPQTLSGLCPRCREHSRAFDSVHSAFLFTGGIRKAIHAFKYQHQRDLAEHLVGSMVQVLPASTSKGTLVCAVPLFPKREKERGYNQAALLAGELARVWSLPLAASDALQRVRETQSQVGLDFPARQANVGEAFRARADIFAGRSVLLVDDVCTTGATLHACAKALREAGAEQVRAITLARAT